MLSYSLKIYHTYHARTLQKLDKRLLILRITLLKPVTQNTSKYTSTLIIMINITKFMFDTLILALKVVVRTFYINSIAETKFMTGYSTMHLSAVW